MPADVPAVQGACTRPHRFEYVGVWTAPYGTYEEVDRSSDTVHRHCREVVAAYTKGTPNAGLARGAGTTYRLPSPEAWARGDRGIRCFHWSDDRVRTRSLKG
ncbi:septum formation family protein [Micromonospora sp. NPDC048830]|uniref:septum formation family protein n=1 Tax=Micromonospora sp. NPDC048830 TaxID=3364257 RepID=UPI0037132CA8